MTQADDHNPIVQATAEELTTQKAAAEEAAAVMSTAHQGTVAALAASEANVDHLLVCSCDTLPMIWCLLCQQ